MDLLPARAGFLTREGNDYLLHDWQDGHRLWRITVDTPGGWGQPDSAWSAVDNPSFALSDDGRYFAASTVETHGVRIRRWHNGKADGNSVVLASPEKPLKPGYYQLSIGNGGRIFFAYFYDGEKAPPGYLLVSNGRRVIARSKLPGQATLLPGSVFVVDSVREIVYAVQVNAGHIRCTRIARVNHYKCVQCPGNYLLAPDGAVYTPAGRKFPPTPRCALSEDDGFYMYGLGYMAKVWPTDKIVFSHRANYHEVFSLSTRSHWSFTSKPGLGEASPPWMGVLCYCTAKMGLKMRRTKFGVWGTEVTLSGSTNAPASSARLCVTLWIRANLPKTATTNGYSAKNATNGFSLLTGGR